MYEIKFLDGQVKMFKSLVGADLQRADLLGAYLQGANLQGAFLQGADLRMANLQEANLQEADLQGADLRMADLRMANLRRADLQGANLQGANLQGAYLQGAYLQGAYLQYTCIISGTLGHHFYFCNGDHLRIGCEDMTLDQWLVDFKRVGEEAGYTKQQIHDYGCLIRFLIERNKYSV